MSPEGPKGNNYLLKKAQELIFKHSFVITVAQASTEHTRLGH